MRYAHAKATGRPFFTYPSGQPREIQELNIQQIILLKWLDFYDFIFSLPDSERPDEETIEDDELLDQWYENYQSKKRREFSNHGSKGKSGQEY